MAAPRSKPPARAHPGKTPRPAGRGTRPAPGGRNAPPDIVEEAGLESFPASDPPSWTP